MDQADFRAARLACPAANREAVEHRLQTLYRLMGWPEFSHVVYTQSKSDYSKRTSMLFTGRARDLHAKLQVVNYEPDLDPWRQIADLRHWQRNRLLLYRPQLPAKDPLAKLWKPLLRELLTFAPQPHVVTVLEKPLEAHFNPEGQPHLEGGPAVIWRNGQREWWYNGVQVSRRFAEGEPTLSYINKQENSERKRVLIERYGAERYLQEMKARCVDEDEHGNKLWRIKGRQRWISAEQWPVYRPGRHANDPDIQFIEVVNSTPEPDGSYKHYFLRVPPRIKRVRAALAWTFRVPAKDLGKHYRPKVET